jgi:hypothetical protein
MVVGCFPLQPRRCVCIHVCRHVEVVLLSLVVVCSTLFSFLFSWLVWRYYLLLHHVASHIVVVTVGVVGLGFVGRTVATAAVGTTQLVTAKAKE